MSKNLKSEIAQHPYVSAIATLLSEKGNSRSDLSDLRDEIDQCTQVVDVLIARYGSTVCLTDETTRPIK